MDAPRQTRDRARQLRRSLTLPEVLLWQALRQRGLKGARFRRQHPLGPYVLDFYCDAARLAVEIDGSSHEAPDQARHDARRTDWLSRRDVAVLRIPARDVLTDLPRVLERIGLRLER